MHIRKIEGIDSVNARKLKRMKISTVEKLLELGGTRRGRSEIEKGTGIPKKQILSWCNRADLMRVSGIGGEYSDLLGAAGVDTVKELARRRVDSLLLTLERTNQQKNVVRRLPSVEQLTRWIDEARKLPAIITH